MARLYDLGWLHEEARRLGWGSLELRVEVSGGTIVTVEVTTERRRRTLNDQERDRRAVVS